jgi:MFS transporter, DHA1 family, multidrug resistance protein
MFMGLALLSGFSMAALFTYVSSASFVFQEGFGLSAQQFAFIFASGAVAITAGTQINGALVGRVAPAQVLRSAVLVGLLITGSMVAVTVLGLGVWPLIVLLISNMLVTGILLPAVPVIALEANAHRAGSAAALLGAMQFGVGAAIAPVTGLFGGGSPVAMATVMFGATVVAAALMLAIRPAMLRTAQRAREQRLTVVGPELSAAPTPS